LYSLPVLTKLFWGFFLKDIFFPNREIENQLIVPPLFFGKIVGKRKQLTGYMMIGEVREITLNQTTVPTAAKLFSSNTPEIDFSKSNFEELSSVVFLK